jgi:hypothetical protein
MTADLCSTVISAPPLPDFPMLPQAQESGCEKPRTGVVSEVPQGLSDEERDDEMTFQGKWVEEFAELRAKFDVKAQAVRRRMGGRIA